MKPSYFEQTIEHQFDSLVKKVINAVVKTYHRDMKSRNRFEYHSVISLILKHTAFDVLGEQVHVADDKLVDALKSLPEKKLVTIEEASKYFHIGEKKLRKIAVENKNSNWVIFNGNWVQIKRKQFEKIIDNLDVI